MKYYKKINDDGSLNLIGTTEKVTDGAEITKDEYDNLYQYIIENAEHIDIIE